MERGLEKGEGKERERRGGRKGNGRASCVPNDFSFHCAAPAAEVECCRTLHYYSYHYGLAFAHHQWRIIHSANYAIAYKGSS
jgi:hypothetical protein